MGSWAHLVAVQPPVVTVPHLHLCTACRHICIMSYTRKCIAVFIWCERCVHGFGRTVPASAMRGICCSHTPAEPQWCVWFGTFNELVIQQYNLVATIPGAFVPQSSWCPSFRSNTAAPFILCLDCNYYSSIAHGSTPFPRRRIPKDP
jgi:hypothetical protein